MDAGYAGGDLAYIAMEWLEGCTLEEELITNGPLGFERTAEILRQIAAALAAAHAAHIIHRDLKPSNVMLIERSDGREQVKVLDFGIAKALDRDPNNALAWSGLADSWFLLGPVGVGALPALEAMPKQKAAAIMALELNDTLAEAHTSLAVVKLVYDWDWAGAEQGYQRALALNPSYAIAHNWYGIYFSARARSDEAIAATRRALEIDPFSVNFNNTLARHYYHARQFNQAAAQYRKTIAGNPKAAVARADLARAYAQQRQSAEALDERASSLLYIKVDPIYDRLRSDRRFAELLGRIG
ncbi:MAG: protein kinase domain-containing protein [Blastocatellia bacterium]